MALRDILVHLDDSPSGLTRMRLAADLARRTEARLIVLYISHRTDAQLHQIGVAEMGLVPATKLAALEMGIKSELDETTARLRLALDGVKQTFVIDVEWRCITSDDTTQTLIQHARCADLAMLGYHINNNEETNHEYSFTEIMLFTLGRPVIIVPAEYRGTTLGRKIAIGWNASRPAARAVADALPLIEKSEDIKILTVNPTEFARRGALPAEMLADNFRRHGPRVSISQTEVHHSSIGDALQSQARTFDADLLVVGAYGHPRIWEKLLGGVTRDILARTTLPLLMAT